MCSPPPDIPPYKTAIEKTVAQRNKETRALKDRDTYGRAFLQTTNLWEHNAKVKEYVTGSGASPASRRG